MANTLSADLFVDIASERAITVLGDVLAPLNIFTTDFSDEAVARAKPGATMQVMQVPVATGGSAVQTNPTSYQSGDTTVSVAEVTPALYSKSFHVTDQERNKGYKLEHMLDINLRLLAYKLLDVAMTPVTVANFGTAVVDVTAANFDSDDLKELWAALEKGTQKNALLSGAYFAKLLPSTLENYDVRNPRSGIAGFDQIHHCSRFTGADPKVAGFSASPEALAIVSRLPNVSAAVMNGMLDTAEITIPRLGVTVRWCHWADTQTRDEWMSYDVVFGAGVGDATALKIMTDGT